MTILAPHPYTGRTKKTVIEMAFEELAISGFEFDITPDEVAKALRRLNVLMASDPFNKMGYNHPYEEDGSPAEASGIPEEDVFAVVKALALHIAPMIGKTVSAEFRGTANQLISALRVKYATIPKMDMAHLTLRGAGSKGRYSTFFPPAFDEAALATDNDPGDLAALTGA